MQRYMFTFEANVVVSPEHDLQPPPRTIQESEGWNHISADPIKLLRGSGGKVVLEVRLERMLTAEGDVQAIIDGRSLAIAKLRKMGLANPELDIHSRRIAVEHYAAEP